MMAQTSIRLSVLVAAVGLLFMASCSAFKPAAGTSANREATTRGSTNINNATAVNAIVNMAEDLVGTKYKYGGNNPREGFDCSGLSVWVYDRAADVQLPRTSYTQVDEGRRVRVNDARVGDLVFFSRSGRVFHVAIVVDAAPGQLWVVHATTSR
ncbi:MAG: C40 family peptidase, partial [Bacteroidota bacterium]